MRRIEHTRLRTSAAGAAALALASLLLAVAAGPAGAVGQKLDGKLFGDSDATMRLKVKKSKSGRPTRVEGLRVTGYDLSCSAPSRPNVKVPDQEVSFSFAPIKVRSQGSSDPPYVYAFDVTDDGGPFSKDFYLHSATAKGWFTASRGGKLTKLSGYLSVEAVTYSMPGLPATAVICSDPDRRDRFAKVHGLFSIPLR